LGKRKVWNNQQLLTAYKINIFKKLALLHHQNFTNDILLERKLENYNFLAVALVKALN